MHSVRQLLRFSSRRLPLQLQLRTQQQLEVCRAFSAPSSNPEPDWVKESIHKLLEHHYTSPATAVEREGPRDLDKSLQALQVSSKHALVGSHGEPTCVIPIMLTSIFSLLFTEST
jgi:hypothetical protein